MASPAGHSDPFAPVLLARPLGSFLSLRHRGPDPPAPLDHIPVCVASSVYAWPSIAVASPVCQCGAPVAAAAAAVFSMALASPPVVVSVGPPLLSGWRSRCQHRQPTETTLESAGPAPARGVMPPETTLESAGPAPAPARGQYREMPSRPAMPDLALATHRKQPRSPHVGHSPPQWAQPSHRQ